MRETYASSSASSASSPRVADVPAQISVSREAPSLTRRRRIRHARSVPWAPSCAARRPPDTAACPAGCAARAGVERPDQQVVQHLVVRQQDVRRPFAQRVPVGDDVVPAHRLVGRPLRLVVATDEDSRGDPAAQRRRAVDGPGDAPRLVRRQRVHRVDEDGLDARRPGPFAAVIEDGEEEALRLARAGAGGDHRRPPGVRGQSRERRALVAVRSEPEGHLRERLAALGRRLERQGDGEIRPLARFSGRARKSSTTCASAGFDGPKPVARKSPSAPVTSVATTEGIMGQTPEDTRDGLRAAASSGCLDSVA